MLNLKNEAKIVANAEKYTKKIVAFVDVMGIKKKMVSSKQPGDVVMYQMIMHVFGKTAKASSDPLTVSMFTDCMYVIADKDKIENILEFLSSLAYSMFYNKKGNQECDCLKLRGGVTYGDVFIQEGEKSPNIFFGPAMINAYLYESEKAFYPRIIVDKEAIGLIKEQGKSESDFSLIPTEDIDGEIYHYLDFLNYHRKYEERDVNYIKECINFVSKELKEAEGEKENQKKKIKQLEWYKDFLINALNRIGRDKKN